VAEHDGGSDEITDVALDIELYGNNMRDDY
jgi:hypothetical protein